MSKEDKVEAIIDILGKVWEEVGVYAHNEAKHLEKIQKLYKEMGEIFEAT